MAQAPSLAPNIQGSTGMIPYGGNNFFNYGSTGSSANPFTAGLGSSTFGTNSPNFTGSLTGAFGQGTGLALSQFLQSGAGYNPAVFNALVNQLQPQISSDIATLGASAGAAGNRFGSGYELGLGDYLSQVNANEMGMAANLYQQSVQNQIGLLDQSMPYIYQNEHAPGFWASLGEGLLSSALGGLAGGVGGLVGGLFNKGGGGFQGGVTSFPGTSLGSALPPTGISGVPGTVPGAANAGGFDLSTLSNLLQTPSVSGQQTFSDILGAGFAGQSGANILGTAYGSPAN